MNRALLGGITGLLTLLAVSTVAAPSAQSDPVPLSPAARAVQAADALVSARPAALHLGGHDAVTAHRAMAGGRGLQYVPYTRTYRGLQVVGGDFVVVTDQTGALRGTSAAQRATIGALSTTPAVTAAQAQLAARGAVTTSSSVSAPALVVYALGAKPVLAWAAIVTGTSGGEKAIKTVYVDATTASVLGARDRILYGSGNSAYNGPNPIPLDTVKSGANYQLKDPTVTNLSCQNAANNTTFSKTSDAWGDGNPATRETGCVDALFAAQTENRMLTQWLGRNSFDGTGGGWPIRVGLDDENAYYDGAQVQIGHNTANQWIGSIDVVAHEFGHGIDDHTPGGISGGNTQEFVADTFGASTESFANEPSPYDTPDFTVGEEINLVGKGPIRYMYDPSKAGHDNCYSSSIPSEEVHAAAGPGNHWFYLLGNGSSPSNGQPASPTCNGSTLTGLGVQKAITIMYNAMLMKTSASSYLKYRTWTLTAAKNLYPADCSAFDAVKKAWDAVSVPAQAADPTCGTTTPPPNSPTTGNLLQNPGFESGSIGWSGTTGPITDDTGRPARAGTWKLWLGGNGKTASENQAQSVTVPASATRATFTFYLRIDTAESGTRAYDTAKVQIVSGSSTSTLATYSNVDAASSYVLKSFDVSSFKGKTITVQFVMTEDPSLQTSFVVDDTSLTTS